MFECPDNLHRNLGSQLQYLLTRRAALKQAKLRFEERGSNGRDGANFDERIRQELSLSVWCATGDRYPGFL